MAKNNRVKTSINKTFSLKIENIQKLAKMAKLLDKTMAKLLDDALDLYFEQNPMPEPEPTKPEV